jgi:hypothetical protein
MHRSGSVLETIAERVRNALDIGDGDRLSTDYIVRQLIGPAYVELWSEILLTEAQPVLLTLSLTLTKEQERAVLPPMVGEVWGIVEFSDEKELLADAYPRGQFHPRGPNWYVEENELVFRPRIQKDDSDLVLLYVPSGDMLMHEGAGASATTTSLILEDDPAVGMRDRRPSAYNGSVLRLIPTGGVHQERVIDTYDPVTRVVVVKSAFDPAPMAAPLYEIAPRGSQAMMEAIVHEIAMARAIAGKFSGISLQAFETKQHNARRTLLNTLKHRVIRVGPQFERNTIDNAMRNDPGFIAWEPAMGRWW